MEILKLDRKIDEKLRHAAEIIKSGGLVVYPTDTLYGMGCNALNEEAIKKVFAAKRRAASKPIPIAVDSLEMMRGYAILNEMAEKRARKFLPGALTLVLKKKSLPEILTSGSDKVGIRIPNSKIALKLMDQKA